MALTGDTFELRGLPKAWLYQPDEGTRPGARVNATGCGKNEPGCLQWVIRSQAPVMGKVHRLSGSGWVGSRVARLRYSRRPLGNPGVKPPQAPTDWPGFGRAAFRR